MRTLFLSAILLVTALAGCTDDVAPVTARALLPKATDVAGNWVEGPELVGISGVEPFSHLLEGDDEVVLHLDSGQADGRAPAWMYAFAGRGGMAYVIVAAGLGVLAEGVERDDEAGEVPRLGAWSVDSDDAARALRGHDDWPAPADNLTVFWQLTEGEQGPVWMAEAEGPDVSAVGAVDANTGEVLFVESRRAHEPDGPHRTDSWAAFTNGVVTPLTPLTLSHPVESGTAVRVETSGDGLGVALRVVVAGEVVAQETFDGSWTFGADFLAAGGGEVEVIIEGGPALADIMITGSMHETAPAQAPGFVAPALAHRL